MSSPCMNKIWSNLIPHNMSRGLLFILRLETLRSRAESSGGFDTHLEPCLWGHGVWTSHILCSVEKIKVFGLYFYLYHDCIVPMNAEKEQGVGCWFSSCVWNHRARGDPRYQLMGAYSQQAAGAGSQTGNWKPLKCFTSSLAASQDAGYKAGEGIKAVS